MTDIPNKSERQSLRQLETQKAVEHKHLQQTIERAEEAQPPDHYINVATEGVAEYPNDLVKAQGRAGERVAWQEIKDQQGRAIDLNKDVGPNFPIYDIAGPESVASVKVLGIDDGPQLSQSNLDQYRRDFEEAVGHSGGAVERTLGDDWSPAKFNNAALNLHELAKTYDAYPPQLAYSPEAAANYLRHNAELRIPSDHAEQVRADLRQRLFSDDPITQEVQARRLGLDVNSSRYQADAERMIGRVRGIPITSDQLRSILSSTLYKTGF